MTDNQQQIHELDVAIREIVKNNSVKVPSYSKFGGYLCDTDISTTSIATALYNKNYRKVPEGSIVVDKEYLKTELQELEFQACMQMAKKCREFVRQWTGDDDGLLFDLEDFIDKQLGVKIKWRYNND